MYPVRLLPGPIFSGFDTVHICAGGPSLRNFDWERLAQKKVIAINKSLYSCPFAKVLWFSDEKFYWTNQRSIDEHPAPFKCTAYPSVYERAYPNHLYAYRFDSMRGFNDSDPTAINHGNNSGYSAICFAVKAGAKKIVLWGYDFKYDEEGHSHWHDGYGIERDASYLTKKLLPCFDTLYSPLLCKRVEVFNANPDSNLKVWPRITQEEALAK